MEITSVIEIVTPWGPPQSVEHIIPGMLIVSTAGHGGIGLDDRLRKELPPELRGSALPYCFTYQDHDWYEEDCAVAIPLLWFNRTIRRSPEASQPWKHAVTHDEPALWRILRHSSCTSYIKAADIIKERRPK